MDGMLRRMEKPLNPAPEKSAPSFESAATALGNEPARPQPKRRSNQRYTAANPDPALEPEPTSIDEILAAVASADADEKDGEPGSGQSLIDVMRTLDKELDKFFVDSDVRNFRQFTSTINVEVDTRESLLNDCVVAATKNAVLIRFLASNEKTSIPALVLTRELAILLARKLLQSAEISAINEDERWWVIS